MKRLANNISGDFERKKLDVSLLTILVIALIVTISIYLIVFPFKTSFIGILLYERGLTQHLAIYFACIVGTLIFLKITKLQKEFRALKRFWLPDTIKFGDPTDKDVLLVQKSLVKDNHLIAIRCSRVIAAYIQSGNRKPAAELALDDSAFYINASESSYTFPRILIWAIPLLGFIGTVFGISEAVNGFSALLEKAADIELIKAGIGTVTTGLAIAFDTTLLALFLSILVMIPLVLIEQIETRLLLGIDIYINDKLLPLFKEKSGDIDERIVNRAIDKAIKEHLPSPEAVIQPAHEYAKQAATALVQNFVSEASKVQEVSAKFIEQLSQVDRLILEDRKVYTTALEKQQETNQNLIAEIQEIIEAVKTTHLAISSGFINQTQQISDELDRASQVLESRISSLEKATTKIAQIARLQQSLEQVLVSLEKTQVLDRSLLEVRESLIQLKPALEKMSKPRILTFIDSEEDKS
jgi:biopolymer transport protein ExbB/TolQ